MFGPMENNLSPFMKISDSWSYTKLEDYCRGKYEMNFAGKMVTNFFVKILIGKLDMRYL